jgi:hypothetical protein
MGTTVFGSFPGVALKENTGSAYTAPDTENVSTSAAASRRSACDIAIRFTPNSFAISPADEPHHSRDRCLSHGQSARARSRPAEKFASEMGCDTQMSRAENRACKPHP